MVDEEDEDAKSGNHPPASATSSQRRHRDELEALEQETREREFAQPAETQSVIIAERPSFFSRLFWAPRVLAVDPAVNPAVVVNQEPVNGVQPNAETAPPRPFFTKGQSTLASIFSLLLTTTVLFALMLFTFETFYGPILNPLLFNPINHTSIIPTGTVQQLLHATAHDYDRLNRRIGTLEQQRTILPLEVVVKPKRQINWFTPGFGAFIDQRLTSPTAAICKESWSPWPWSYLIGQSCPEDTLSDGSMMALQAWDDPVNDRWCAPKNPFGKMQITVGIERPITPTEMVVEMAAKDTSPVGHMATAPKEIELWIQIHDDDIRRTVSSMIDQLYPDLWRDVSSQGRELAMAQILDYNYVPVGRWKYNIYENQEVQTFKIPVPLGEYGVTSSKVAVRVNSNWGNDEYTCVNRLRLHGDDASGTTEYLETYEA